MSGDLKPCNSKKYRLIDFIIIKNNGVVKMLIKIAIVLTLLSISLHVVLLIKLFKKDKKYGK